MPQLNNMKDLQNYSKIIKEIYTFLILYENKLQNDPFFDYSKGNPYPSIEKLKKTYEGKDYEWRYFFQLDSSSILQEIYGSLSMCLILRDTTALQKTDDLCKKLFEELEEFRSLENLGREYS